MGGFNPVNLIRHEHILFLGNFTTNDSILSQFHVLIMLCESFIASLTVYLPYYPTGTNERCLVEGEIATANTVARMFSNLPQCGRPVRVMIYDIHTLQNRFYLHGNAIADLCSSVPLLHSQVLAKEGCDITAIAFPDDGAAKRFGAFFKERGYPLIVCGKIREGEKRTVTVQDGDAKGHHVLIVDDLVRSGGTLVEGAKAILASGARKVSAFVAHACFHQNDPGVMRRFYRGQDRAIFETFWVTNSVPSITDQLPEGDTFVVIDLLPQILHDL